MYKLVFTKSQRHWLQMCLFNWYKIKFGSALLSLKYMIVILLLTYNFYSVPTLYLLFVTFSSIRRISEDTSNFFDVCFVNNIKNVNHIDFHFHSAGSGKIFWADHAQNSIMSSNFDGSSVQKFIANIISPRGLSVDRSTGNIYYIHGGRVPRIEVMVSIGLFRKVLVEKNLINPTSLVVYPQRGYEMINKQNVINAISFFHLG